MPDLDFAKNATLGFCKKRSEEHTSELQSRPHLVCRLLLEKKKAPVRLSTKRSQTRSPSRYTTSTSMASGSASPMVSFFFFNDTAPTEIYTLSLHDALPISRTSFSLRCRPAEIQFAETL